MSGLKVFRVGKATRIISSMKTASFLGKYKVIAIEYEIGSRYS